MLDDRLHLDRFAGLGIESRSDGEGDARSDTGFVAGFGGGLVRDAGEDDVLRLFAETDRAFGTLNGLVNNAGVTGGRKRRIEDVSFATIMEVMRVNVAGQLICAREAVKRMSIKHGGKGGAIVNVSSYGALTGSPHAFIDYAASKGAFDTMTIGLASETADAGIRVNAVSPGPIVTEMHRPGKLEIGAKRAPMQRAGTPEEVAEAVLFLASPAASYVTGANIAVAGGL